MPWLIGFNPWAMKKFSFSSCKDGGGAVDVNMEGGANKLDEYTEIQNRVPALPTTTVEAILFGVTLTLKCVFPILLFYTSHYCRSWRQRKSAAKS